jgi:cysteine-rich repeat protein
VVGAPRDDTGLVDAGAVYFFPNTSCGNGGPLDPSEQCDDGNLVNGDGCDANCTLTSCGNGIATPPEQCDDGNNAAGDGCSGICGLEGACGDNVVSPFEQCDDGNAVSGDGCDSNCTPTACGNSIVAGAELCDNGASNGVDLCCSATCQRIDADLDGVCDVADVCPNSADPSQSNIDGDIFGDVCDICPGDVNNDSDNDLFCLGSLFNAPAKGGDDPCSRMGGGTWTKPKVLFSRGGAPAGDDSMRL